MTFDGFTASPPRFTPIPEQFFTDLLPQIDDLGELKVTLYALWRFERMEGGFPFLREADFAADEHFLHGLAETSEDALAALAEGLERAARRGTLLRATVKTGEAETAWYLLNTPRGRLAVQAIQRGEWIPQPGDDLPAFLRPQPPNIFRLYEENIGPLTPLLADMLREAEQEYPADWLREAVEIAVQKNVRNWRYVEAILKRWKTEGRDEQEDRGYSEEDRRRYVKGRYADLIE